LRTGYSPFAPNLELLILTDLQHLKVLFVTSWYPSRPDRLSGIFVREQAKAAGLYCDVAVLHLAGGSGNCSWRLEQETDESICEGIPTWRLWNREFPIRGAWRLFRSRDTIQAFEELGRRGVRPDVIHAHVYPAGLAAARIGKHRGIPVVLSEHFGALLRGTLRRREIATARAAFGAADIVLPVSGALQRAIEQYGISARFRIVPNAVDTELFAPGARQPRKGGPVRLLWVAMFSENKGLCCLLRGLADLGAREKQAGDCPNFPAGKMGLSPSETTGWRLDVIGDGPGRSSYEQLAQDSGLADKVVFHGRKQRAEVVEFMRRADIFVLSSTFETFSVVTAEALATGTPVLATRCGGPEELVSEDCGMLVPAGDPAAMAAALRAMIERLPTFDRPAIARRAAERFGFEAVGKMLLEAYTDVTTAAR